MATSLFTLVIVAFVSTALPTLGYPGCPFNEHPTLGSIYPEQVMAECENTFVPFPNLCVSSIGSYPLPAGNIFYPNISMDVSLVNATALRFNIGKTSQYSLTSDCLNCYNKAIDSIQSAILMYPYNGHLSEEIGSLILGNLDSAIESVSSCEDGLEGVEVEQELVQRIEISRELIINAHEMVANAQVLDPR